MDIPTIIDQLDHIMVTKAKYYRETDEIPLFARMEDITAKYMRGYLFVIERQDHQAKVFVGIFETEGKVSVTIVYRVRLSAPGSLKGSCNSYCNAFNAKSSGLKALYAKKIKLHTNPFASKTEKIRLYTTSFVPNTSTKDWFLKLLKVSNDQWLAFMEMLTEWIMSDPIVKQKIEKLKLEIKKLHHEDFVSNLNFYEVVKIVNMKLEERAVGNLERKKKIKKVVFMTTFSMQEAENATCPALGSPCNSTFTVTPIFLSFRLYFSLEGEPFPFLSRYYGDNLSRCIAECNRQLEVGHLGLETKMGLRSFAEIKAIHYYLNQSEVESMVNAMITECTQICQMYFQVFYQLLCSEGERPTALSLSDYPRVIRESPEQSESQAKKEGVSIIPVSELPQPIKDFDKSRISSFSNELPEKIHELFCLDTDRLLLEQLVYWIYWESEDTSIEGRKETAMKCVVDGLKQLWDLGVKFEKLPLDYATLNRLGKLVILPLFPIENILKREEVVDTGIVELNIQCEVLVYLSRKTSSEKHAMHQELKVYREMEDVDFIPPDQFSKKELIRPGEKCGSGGFGEVYPNNLHGMPVALKAAKKLDSKMNYSREKMQSEFVAMQACTHENVVRALGYTEYQGQVLLVMERCRDDSLSQYIKNNNPSFKERVRVLTEVADALTLMHAKRIAHLDIKPQNVLLTDDLTPKICDFGSSVSYPTERTDIPTTVMYAAPEQVRGRPELKSDVWSFGVLMYFTLFGKNPFDYVKEEFKQLEKREIFEKVVQRRYRPLFEPEFERNHPELVQLIHKCLQIDPGDRPAFNDIVLRLDEILQSLT